jgi:hypothetical protein
MSRITISCATSSSGSSIRFEPPTLKGRSVPVTEAMAAGLLIRGALRVKRLN